MKSNRVSWLFVVVVLMGILSVIANVIDRDWLNVFTAALMTSVIVTMEVIKRRVGK